MFVPAAIHTMIEVPADWQDQASREGLGSILASALRQPPTGRPPMVDVQEHINEAWKHLLKARKLADEAELSEENKAKLKALMWALEQFDI